MCKVMPEKKKIWLVHSVQGQTSKVGSRQLARLRPNAGTAGGEEVDLGGIMSHLH